MHCGKVFFCATIVFHLHSTSINCHLCLWLQSQTQLKVDEGAMQLKDNHSQYIITNFSTKWTNQ